MRHFIDKINTISNQCVDSAIIFDSRNKRVGTIYVRYTKGTNGTNVEVGVLFTYKDTCIDFSKSKKGTCYDSTGAFHVFDEHNIKCFDCSNVQILSYAEYYKQRGKGNTNISLCESYSTNKAIEKIKLSHSTFKVIWV